MNRYTTPANLRDGATFGERERLCAGCGQWFPFTEAFFHHCRSNASGLVARCKTCLCAAQIARNRARIQARIGPRNGAGPPEVRWARYGYRTAKTRV